MFDYHKRSILFVTLVSLILFPSLGACQAKETSSASNTETVEQTRVTTSTKTQTPVSTPFPKLKVTETSPNAGDLFHKNSWLL